MPLLFHIVPSPSDILTKILCSSLYTKQTHIYLNYSSDKIKRGCIKLLQYCGQLSAVPSHQLGSHTFILCNRIKQICNIAQNIQFGVVMRGRGVQQRRL
jgi:hypothetical protein